MPKLEILPEHVPLSDSLRCVVLHVKGFIDAPNYEQFYATLEKAAGGDRFLILELSGLNYINSTGISAIIRCQGLLSQAGGALVLAHVPRQVGASLNLLGLTSVVPLVKDMRRAQEVIEGVAQKTLPPGGLKEASEIKETARRIPVWPQKPLASTKATVLVVVPEQGHFTDVLNLRLGKSRAQFHLFHSCEEALKHFKRLSPDVVVVDDRLDPKGLFIARVKIEQGAGLSSVIKLYPTGAEIRRRAGFRIWENDYLVDPFELMELFSLAEAELRRVPHDRKNYLQEVRYAFRSTPDRVQKAYELAFKLMAKSGLAVNDLDSFYAAFKEAVDNAVRHGNRQSPDKLVEVIYLLERDRVRVQVTDEGKGFDYEFYLAWSVSTGALEEAKRKIVKEGRKGGLGILLMRRCADKLEYRGTGNVVCLEKKIA